MKLTKYVHACMVLEENGKRLVIDPGGFTPDFGGTDNIAAIVVTHVHQDHYNADHLDAIFAANPEATLYTTQEVIDQYRKGNSVIAQDGQTATVGPFTLAFTGDLHALVHQSIPRIHNIAVSVNDVFFYPGDSYTIPAATPTILAVPLDAPWMRISESMDYVTRVKPQQAFGTHDALLSDAGHSVYGGALQQAAQGAGVKYTALKPNDSIEL